MRSAEWRCKGAAPVLLATLLAGCASPDPDAGFSAVRQSVKELRGHDIEWVRDEEARSRIDETVRRLLAEPLSMDAAVAVALLNNRGLQAAFEELGISDAERAQALRWPNPGFSVGRSVRGDEVERELGVHLDIGLLLAQPMIRRLESRRLARAQGLATLTVLQLAADARRAWVQAVAAEQGLHYARQVLQAAEAGGELARRMAAVGNFNKLQLAREQSFKINAALSLARAEQLRQAHRERLTRLLGLWGDQAAFRLPDRLPELPAEPRELPQIERLALEQRLDVQGARLAVEQTAQQLGLTRATRFVNVFEIGLSRTTSNEAPVEKGWEIGFEVPLFDWGEARVARAEGLYRQSVARAAATAIEARSEVREAYGAYRSAFDIARFNRDERVPLARLIGEENQLRYNGMLISVFELLADARMQSQTVQAAIEAQRDFWLAEADLEHALIGRPSLAALALAPQSPAAGAKSGADH